MTPVVLDHRGRMAGMPPRSAGVKEATEARRPCPVTATIVAGWAAIEMRSGQREKETARPGNDQNRSRRSRPHAMAMTTASHLGNRISDETRTIGLGAGNRPRKAIPGAIFRAVRKTILICPAPPGWSFEVQFLSSGNAFPARSRNFIECTFSGQATAP